MQPSKELSGLGKRPQKQLGQNFLVDQKVVDNMLETGDVSREDTIIEIGPGLGALTKVLGERAKKVIAIEADYELAANLREQKIKNVSVIAGDALQVDWTISIEHDYKVIANIPYSLTSPLLRKAFQLEKRPTLLTLLIQKEMAERICAAPGESNRGFLTLLTEVNAEAKIIRKVMPGSFYPSPKVESAIILIVPKEKSLQEEIFWPAVEAGFRHKRQTLANSLRNDLSWPKPEVEAALEKLGLTKLARPAELSFEQWKAISALKEKLS
jgi:16S rRNA (adenine1518-N6/adenine1519-N6)-dimethyltransferase